MPGPFDAACSICGEPTPPNLSQADADGCPWICIDPDCLETLRRGARDQGPGGGRRAENDVMAYRAREEDEREARLARISQESQSLGLEF